MRELVFNYPSTAKIRLLKAHCFQNDRHPYVYRIVTKRLDFLVPRNFTILTKEHIFIPLDYYKQILADFYKSIIK